MNGMVKKKNTIGIMNVHSQTSESKIYWDQFKFQFYRMLSMVEHFVRCAALSFYDACVSVGGKIVFAISITFDLYLKLNFYLLFT